ncbi:TBPIP-domain-containing protein [Schizopora paradoxa]|uniref:TBPIP-domain-containing protein n=1 Tax=Schizopora paradoxa TaxID=27342 RepID=A0A0H2S875_9AGAM|nr:TBPIP-domain-containing protein [Schizopora paradoxa]
MPSKTKDSAEKDKTPVLKGQEAEDKVLEYMKMMNRPFGAVDVCANLKGAVPKATTQKILVSLAEKGEVTQKVYGKTTFFVVKQSGLEDVSAEKLAELEEESKTIDEENKALAIEIKTASAELAKLKSTPTDGELNEQVEEAKAAVQKTLKYLQPLRSGAPLISPEEIEKLDKDWIKWRMEWINRKKVFTNLWHLVTDSLPPQEAAELVEDLGIEYDSPEHTELEKGPLCNGASNPLKRKR